MEGSEERRHPIVSDWFLQTPIPLHPLPTSVSNPRTVYKYRVWANSFWSSYLWKIWIQEWFRDGRPEAHDQEGCVIWCSLSSWALFSCVEKAMAPHSSSLAWKIPWTEEPGRLQSMGSLRVGHDWATSLSLSCVGGGNGNPLQCSCLENPRDGGAWWAAVYGVAQSRTQLKWLSRVPGLCSTV